MRHRGGEAGRRTEVTVWQYLGEVMLTLVPELSVKYTVKYQLKESLVISGHLAQANS